MLKELIQYLSERRKLAFLIAAAYLVFIVLMHDLLVQLSVYIMLAVTLPKYDIIVGIVTLSILFAIIFLFIKMLKANREALPLKITWLVLTTLMILAHTQMNFVMNIEIIHAFQFGIMAILVFPLTRSFGATLFFVTLTGYFDEWYQYVILYPEKEAYFDFNDIVVDQLGAGFAIVMIYSAGINNRIQAWKKWYRSPVLITALIFATSVFVLFKTEKLQTFYNESDNTSAWMYLIKQTEPYPFWREIENTDIIYHVMTPVEGVSIHIFLILFFYLLDLLAWKNRRDKPGLE